MPIYSRYILLASILLLAIANSAARADTYEMRAVPGLPHKTAKELAHSSEPIWYTVESPSAASLRSIIKAVCGKQDKDTTQLIFDEALRVNLAQSLDTPIRPGITVAIPFCLKIESNVAIQIRPNDTIEGILKREYGLYGPTTKSQVFALNATKYPSFKNVEELSRKLVPGRQLMIPYKAVEQEYTERSGSTRRLEEIINDSARDRQTELLRSTIRKVSASANATAHTVEYVDFISSEEARITSTCSPPSHQQPILQRYDLPLLKSRIMIEKELASARGHAGQTTIIGLIDTGLKIQVPFRESHFQPNERELNGIPFQDDDDNRFIDDIFGVNFNTYNGHIEYYSTDVRKSHGTKIASLLLGGPSIMSGSISDQLHSIRLKVVNFSSSGSFGGTMGPATLPLAMEYLMANKAAVINMSLSAEREYEGIGNALRKSSNTLVVAAAGNTRVGDRTGVDLGLERVYPARYGGFGGDFKDKVITVAAHDFNGKLASFSNYSSDYVDLLAPGCSVETYDTDGQVVFESGTSPATAIVSFTAALISALGNQTPLSIKTRLLISTDGDPDLKSYAWSSGRLNIIKAISLRSDVIEVKSPSTEYIFGKLRDKSELPKFCGDPRLSRHLNNIRKVRPNVSLPDGNQIEYWTELDGHLKRTSCPQVLSDQSVGTIVSGGTSTPGPTLDKIIDIVLSDY